MENINQIVSENLLAIRQSRQLTLQELSGLTGVSKSMLGEIERGTSNPTITVLWKIITGLNISFSQLVYIPKEAATIVKPNQWERLSSPPARLDLIIHSEEHRNFEMFHLELEFDGEFHSADHRKGVVEYLFVYQGNLDLKVNKTVYHLNQGDSIYFDANCAHSYKNTAQISVKAYALLCCSKDYSPRIIES